MSAEMEMQRGLRRDLTRKSWLMPGKLAWGRVGLGGLGAWHLSKWAFHTERRGHPAIIVLKFLGPLSWKLRARTIEDNCPTLSLRGFYEFSVCQIRLCRSRTFLVCDTWSP